jgi:Uma2 family endonuclease
MPWSIMNASVRRSPFTGKEAPMSAASKPYVSPKQYLELERQAEFKSEYFDGGVFAMSGGSSGRSLIAANEIREVGQQLLGTPCRVNINDPRVHASKALYTYPDANVVCGALQFSDELPRDSRSLSPIGADEIARRG